MNEDMPQAGKVIGPQEIYAILFRRRWWLMLPALIGMALGGWVSGKIFDLTGSYAAAFVHGLAWNALNLSIVVWLIVRSRRARGPVEPAALAV
jgi:hypothetical protein